MITLAKHKLANTYLNLLQKNYPNHLLLVILELLVKSKVNTPTVPIRQQNNILYFLKF
jgi:hypothetical protein